MRRAPSAIVLSVVVLGCSTKPPAPPKPPSPATDAAVPPRELGPLVYLGPGEDRVGPRDAPVAPDGLADYAFRVRISGPVAALLLTSSEANGTPWGDEVWDTLTSPSTIPKEWKLPYDRGSQTWALAVVDPAGKTLNPSTTLEHVFHGEVVTLHCADPGASRFRPGKRYTLMVIRPDQSVDRTTTTLL